MRLIDADALLQKQYRIDDSATLSTRDVVDVEDIEDAPTVCDIEPISSARYNNGFYDGKKAMEEKLEQIRAEIQKPMRKTKIFDTETQKAQMLALAWCLEIIDKYTKGESE